MVVSKDRRNILCYITEKGERIVEDLVHVKTNVEDDIFKGFKDEDKQIFYKYLSRMNHNSEALVASIDLKIEED